VGSSRFIAMPVVSLSVSLVHVHAENVLRKCFMQNSSKQNVQNNLRRTSKASRRKMSVLATHASRNFCTTLLLFTCVYTTTSSSEEISRRNNSMLCIHSCNSSRIDLAERSLEAHNKQATASLLRVPFKSFSRRRQNINVYLFTIYFAVDSRKCCTCNSCACKLQLNRTNVQHR